MALNEHPDPGGEARGRDSLLYRRKHSIFLGFLDLFLGAFALDEQRAL